MIHSTQIARLDGLMLCASVDDEQSEASLSEIKSQMKMILRRLNRNSEGQASIESGPFSLQNLKNTKSKRRMISVKNEHMVYSLAVKLIPLPDKNLYRTYALRPLELTTIHSPALRPYAFMEFDTFISRTKRTYSDTRATQNLDKLNDELRDVTNVMTKNIEDLLYRGDSLDRMGEVSSRLREDSRKYRKAAVRINWDLLLKQYGPIGGLGLLIFTFLWWRFL